MAVYRDIDADVRIGGSLTLPTGSILLPTGQVSAVKFIGDGSALTNLPIPETTNNLLIDGTRAMTGTLNINTATTHIALQEAGVVKWRLDSTSGAFRIIEGASTNRLSFAVGGNATFANNLTVTGNLVVSGTGTHTFGGNITATGKVITAGTVNATVAIQEAGVAISTKYEVKGTLHDDRYYTETEIDTQLGGKADTSHAHAAGDINSGTLALARIPTGTTASTVALGNHNHTIDSLSNTSITSIATGHFLEWNGTAWVNNALVVGDIPALDTGKITSGTFAIARIPTGVTATTVALGNHNHTLDGLANVTITSNVNGEILRWNGTAWVNNTLAEAGIQPAGSYSLTTHNHTLDTLSNTTITSNSNGEILKWNGTAWINNTLAEAGIQPVGSYSTTGHGHVIADVTDLQTSLNAKLDATSNAVSATKIQTARTITLSGAVTGSISFDGSTNVTIATSVGHSHTWGDITSKPTTFAPSTHTHIIGDITGLQGALDDKSASTHVHAIDILSNVTISAPAAGHFLEWNGTAWTNSALIASDIPALDTAKITSGTFALARIPTGTTSTTVSLGNHNHTLDGLSNTTITSNTNGEILRWNGTAWINNTLAEAGIQAAGSYSLATHNHTLDSLSNTTITSNVNGEILRWNGTAWINNTLAEAGIQPAGSYSVTGHAHVIGDVTGLQGMIDGKADAAHTHAIADVIDLQTTLNGKAASSHTHLWAHLTDKPTTFTPGSHSHPIAEITNLQTTLNGKSDTNHTHDYQQHKLTNGTVAISAITDWNNYPNTGFYMGSGLLNGPTETGAHTWWYIQVIQHNVTPGYSVQTAWDFNGISMQTRTKANGAWTAWKKIWHEGNITPLTSGAINQTVGSGFSVGGNLYVGATPSTAGTVQIRNGVGKIAIEIGTPTKGSDAKAYIASDGSADFDGVVEVQSLKVMDTNKPLVTNLNAEYINGVKEYQLANTQVHTDIAGYGVVTGLNVTSLNSGSNVQVEPGVAYTESGIRIEIKTGQSISLSNASSSNNRYDIIYILGSKYENGSNTLTNEGQLSVFVGPVAATPTIPLASLPQGAIPIAALYRLKAATGGNTVVNVADINMAVKLMRPINLLSTGLSIDRKVDIAGDLSAIKGTYSGDVTLSYSSPNLIIESTDGNTSDTKPSTLFLKEGGGTHGLKLEYMGASNFGAITTVLGGVSTERMRFWISTNLTEIKTDVTITGTLKSAKTAKTVTIPKGTVTATWVHNFGNTAYVVNLTPNSFARHVRWTAKVANSVTIEIDDVYDEDILVDCIIIGY